MSSKSNYDVVVVGNGVIGLSVGYELARRQVGLRIAVCGPAARPGAASAAAGAMLNTFGEVTQYTLQSAAGRAKFELCRQALDRWPAWLAGLKEVPGNERVDRSLTHGTTVVLNAKSSTLDDANFAALAAAFRTFEEPYEEVDPAAVPGLLPTPEGRPLRALHAPREGAIDARAVLAGLDVAARALGVELIDDTVTDVRVAGGRAAGVELRSGAQLAAPTVLLAAGSFLGPLTEVLGPGAVPAMLAGKGIAALTRRAPFAGSGVEHVVRTPTRSGACGLHVIPLGDGVEYLGATNVVVGQPVETPDFGWSQFLLEVAHEQIDRRFYFSEIEQWLVGNRPVTIDGLPMIGRTSIDGLLLATGTYRDGFHCSPVIAELVADDVLGEARLAQRLPHFVPERPPVQLFTVAEAVTELAFTFSAGAIEHSIKLPPWHTDTAVLDAHYAELARRYYDVLDHPIGLLPEVLLAVIFDADLAHHPITRYLNAAHRRYGTGG